MTSVPLLDVFTELRRRDFPIGIREYDDMLRALDNGLAGSRAQLVFVCQTLWAKNKAECEEVAEVIERRLPVRPGEPAVRRAVDEAAGMGQGILERGSQALDRMGEKVTRMIPTVRRKAVPGAAQEGGGEPGYSTGPIVLPKMHYKLTRDIDWVGSLPITRRQMKRAWQYYRRMARRGPAVEFDIDGTLARIHREGVLIEPVLVPRRVNRARLLVLADVGGSMVPFRAVVGHLIASAASGNFAATGVYYFHDVPDQAVFATPWLAGPVPLADVCARFSGDGVMIVSDGGAARGNRDPVRVQKTVAVLEKIRAFTSHIAWLNPMPTSRWPRSSAEEIRVRSRVPMFPLERTGLDRAVDAMRGMARAV